MYQSEQDVQVTQQLRKQIGENPDIVDLKAKDDFLRVDISDKLHRSMAIDRERGKKIVVALMRSLKSLTGSEGVRVWVYCNNEKVIEGDVKLYGGDQVNYLADV